MEYIVTAINPHQHGFITRAQPGNIYLYLLGYTKSLNSKRKLMYSPKFLTYKKTTTYKEYLETYLGLSRAQLHRRFTHTANILRSRKIDELFRKYEEFKQKFPLFSSQRDLFYIETKVNKRTGKLGKNGRMYYKKRTLAEPMEDLKELHKLTKEIIEYELKIKTHDCAHGYVKTRSNVTNAEVHKYSNHLVNIDLKDFFNTINPAYLKTVLYSLKEFAILRLGIGDINASIDPAFHSSARDYKNRVGKLFDIILDIIPYKNGIAQGSPLSPTISNIVMTKIDIKIGKLMRKKRITSCVAMYTRYSDDLTISSYNPIQLNTLLDEIKSIVLHTPFKINEEKTKYVKTSNRCYVTGVKINKNHDISYGHEKKALLKNQLFNLLMAKKEGQEITKEATKVLGTFAYMKSIEPVYTKNLIIKYANKFNIDPKQIYKYLTT